MLTAFPEVARALGDTCLGILGAGHLGRALARGLVAAGYPTDRLRLAHRGSPDTRAALEGLGLAGCVADARELARACRVVLVTLRPQEMTALADLPLRGDALVVSFMAGMPLTRLPFGDPAIRRARVMPSPPYTIDQRRGIAAVFPGDDLAVTEVCAAVGADPIPMEREDTLHAFTALGVCLPIALTLWRSFGREQDDIELSRLAERYELPGYARILAWAHATEQRSLSGAELERFLAAGATRGGVTEAILEAIRAGAGLAEALERGVARSRALQGGG